MTWSVPAKTFFVGEYAAVFGAPAFLLTTTPCFELIPCQQPGLHNIHPESPAGRWWSVHGLDSVGLEWRDPYQGLGGLGASSAQFLAVYWAQHQLSQSLTSTPALMNDYFNVAWKGLGLRPSGYDVLAQQSQACVFVNKAGLSTESFSWVFDDLAFVLLHSKQKLATHEHLESLNTLNRFQPLAELVEQAKLAFDSKNTGLITDTVNEYHRQLQHANLVAEHSLHHIKRFQNHPKVLAVKGCGAMGADVILLLVAASELKSMIQELTQDHWTVLATNHNLYQPLPTQNFREKLQKIT